MDNKIKCTFWTEDLSVDEIERLGDLLDEYSIDWQEREGYLYAHMYEWNYISVMRKLKGANDSKETIWT